MNILDLAALTYLPMTWANHTRVTGNGWVYSGNSTHYRSPYSMHRAYMSTPAVGSFYHALDRAFRVNTYHVGD